MVYCLSVLMKTIFTIAAIAMFAVTLGLGLMSPALASQPDENGKHKIKFCHYQEEKLEIIDDDGMITQFAVPEDYLVIETDNKGKMNGHFKGNPQVAHHFPDENDDGEIDDGGQGDFIFTNDDEVNNPTDENDSEADCLALHDEFNPDEV